MRNKSKKIFKPKIIFTDFDGCLTDDRVWLNDEGIEYVAANRKDGLAANRLNSLGIKLVIASTETNKVVLARGKKMGVEVLQGLNDKANEIDSYLKNSQTTWADIWYVGNDVNDLGAIQRAGISICPGDAVKRIKKEADIVLKTSGGQGILAEITRLIEAIKS
jgi:YrbI family 3-deoxy-D-manno-octulosonate 8-phosphate phosphatase